MANKKPGKVNSMLAKRIVAFLADLVIVFLVMEMLSALLGINRAEMPVSEQLKFDITSNVVFSLYCFLFTGFFMKGQTIGKRMMGIGVVSRSSEDGKILKSELLAREFIGKLFIEKANIWLCFIFVATGLQDKLFGAIGNNALSTAIYYIMIIPWPMLVSFSMVINREDRRAIHDFFGNTEIVPMQRRFKFD